MSMPTPYPIKRLKILTLGNSETGKSCVIKRYSEHRFVTRYMPTIGIDYGVSKVHLKDNSVSINIFDTSGNPTFYEIRNEFYKDTQGLILVYDVTNKVSFDALSVWVQEFQGHLLDEEAFKRVIVIVLGNKCDLLNRQVDEIDAKIWCEKRNFLHYETSAKLGINIMESLMDLFNKSVFLISNGYRQPEGQIAKCYSQDELNLVHRIRNATDDNTILGVAKGAPKKDILKAYKNLAMLLHPDKNKAPGSEEAFKLVGQARTNLTN